MSLLPAKRKTWCKGSATCLNVHRFLHISFLATSAHCDTLDNNTIVFFFVRSFVFSDDEEETKRVVRSQKDKR